MTTKLKFQATEMKAAKVERISLVARGATRIPLRIIKEDPTMKKPGVFGDFDLASVFKREKSAPTPVVTGVIAMKSEDAAFEQVKTALVDAGFVVEKADETTGDEVTVVAFAQTDEPVDPEHVVIKMSPDVAVVVKGFSPYNMDMAVGDVSFSEACQAQGFYPGLSTVVDVMRNSVYAAVSKGDDPAEAASSVAKMFDEAKNYCVGLVKALPSKAFKLEAIVAELPEEDPAAGSTASGDETALTEAELAEVAKMAMPEGMDKAKWDAMSPAEKKQHAAMMAAEADKAKTAKSDDKAPVQKAEQPQLDLKALAAQISEAVSAPLKTMVEGVQKSVAELNETVGGLGKRVEAAEAVAKAAKETVDGTVVGSVEDDHVNTQKSDNGGYRSREIDTGFAPRRRPGQR